MNTGNYQMKKIRAKKHNANYKVQPKVKRKNLNPPPRVRAGLGNRDHIKTLGLSNLISLLLGRYK